MRIYLIIQTTYIVGNKFNVDYNGDNRRFTIFVVPCFKPY